MSEEDAGAIIAAGFVVQGAVRGKGALQIHGRVEGPVELDGEARIGKLGRVTGGLVAGDVLVEGVVDGSVRATGHVELRAGCVVHGAVLGGSVKVEQGAETRGGVGLAENTGDAREVPRAPSQPRLREVSEPALAPRLGRRSGRWRRSSAAWPESVPDIVK